MSRSGGFGHNPNKSYGTAPSITEWKVGDIASDKRGDWMYIKANSAISQYDFVQIDPTYAAAVSMTTTTLNSASSSVGVAQVAIGAAEYGFVWVGGVGGGGTGVGIKGKIAASVTTGAVLTSTATAGVAGASGTTIKNVISLVTTTGAATVELSSDGYLGC